MSPKHLRNATRFMLLGLGVWLPLTGMAAETIVGAGSSAAAPVYKAWGAVYGKKNDVQLAYDPVGSGAGLQKVRAKEVAFGATDVAPPDDVLTKDQLVMVPTFVSGVAPVVNLPKVGNNRLKLSGDVLAGIFSGALTRWNAPEIQSLNADMVLPDLPIKPIVRSDSSGTTYYFTDYLARVNPAWKDKYGNKNLIKWPETLTAVKGSSEVAKTVRSTPGAIGYLDANYVAEFDLSAAQVRNAAGEFVSANAANFRTALRASDWFAKGDFHATLANMPGRTAWPITMGTFVVFPRITDKSADTSRALRFVTWALMKGDPVVEGMSFVRLPDKIQGIAFKNLSAVTDSQGKTIGLEALSLVSAQ
jgi:phosphate transport system substrate-binding protein